jgi:hypothetical protein
LKLRQYVLNEKPYQNLLINVEGLLDGNKQIRRYLPRTFTENVRYMIDPNFPLITTRQWRAHKSDYLIKNTDIATTALILQNSTDTVMKAYAEGSETEAEADLGEFYAQLTKKIFTGTSNEGHHQSSVGHCINEGSPVGVISSKFTPDCKTPEGCLFCENYAVHADAVDIRKLASLSFIISETENLANSRTHFLEIFGEVLKIIDSILASISSRSSELKKLVDGVVGDVKDNENLDPYWGAKLDNFVKIGIL